MKKTYIGSGVFVKIIEPVGTVQLTVEVDGEIEDLIVMDRPAIENLLKFLERMK